MRLSPYGKQAIKWLVVSFALFAATAVVRELAWAKMLAGGDYVLAFTALVILGTLATFSLIPLLWFLVLLTID